MALTEKDRYELGGSTRFYEEALLEAAQEMERIKRLRKRQVIKAEDMAWESSRHGRIKHLINEKMGYPVRAVDLYLMVLPPGGRSGKHRHMAEEVLYILEGLGYDMHWDPDVEISDKYYWRLREEGVKYEWEKGDLVYIPPMVAHQHFNADPQNRARLLAASHRGYRFLGYPELEQLEDAPDYKP
ncbi:MAG: hypothetical protein ACE5IA_00725 [Dehalococcoidia bacterium]